MCQARGDEEGSGFGRLPGQGRGKGAIKLDIEGGRGGRRKRPLKTREGKRGRSVIFPIIIGGRGRQASKARGRRMGKGPSRTEAAARTKILVTSFSGLALSKSQVG